MIQRKIVDYYTEKIEKNSEDYKIHGWESQEAQNIRLDVLIKNFDLKKKSLLDVGCGVGTLYKKIRDAKISCDYLGIDILDGMVQVAKKNCPSALFLTVNILEENPFDDDCFDFVFSSGIFNLNYGNNEDLILDYLKIFMKISNRYVICNFLSDKSKNREGTYFYTNKESVEFLIKKSKIKYKNFKFIENYLDNDFTLVLEKV